MTSAIDKDSNPVGNHAVEKVHHPVYHCGQAVSVWSTPYGRRLAGRVERASGLSVGVELWLPGGGIIHDEVLAERVTAGKAERDEDTVTHAGA